MKIRALVIDDEPLAQEVLKTYVSETGIIEVQGYCSNALEAMQMMHEQEIDLVFLDINMPKLSGIEWIKSLKKPPLIILTTAYTQYALEGYELNVLDYLAKPFSLQRFLKAVAKAEEQLLGRHSKEINEQDSIFIKSNRKNYQVRFEDVVYVEGLGDYIKIYTESTHYVTNISMKRIEDQLPTSSFFRIHKSFIVNLKKIVSIEGNLIDVKINKLAIGNNYRQNFFSKIEQMSL